MSGVHLVGIILQVLLHTRGRHSLQQVYDKGRKDHCFYKDQAQPLNCEHDSSSVHQHLQYKVCLQTCGKLVVLKIPVKECWCWEKKIWTMEYAHFMLSKNQVFFSQTKGGPCLSNHFSFMTLSNAASSQSIPVTITKFLLGHSYFKNVYTMSSHLYHPNSPFTLQPSSWFGSWESLEDIPGLCLFNGLEKSWFELASNARTCMAFIGSSWCCPTRSQVPVHSFIEEV